MINVGIFNGDYIIVREQKSAMNGEIVVAMIDGSATVKTFYKEQGACACSPRTTLWSHLCDEPRYFG